MDTGLHVESTAEEILQRVKDANAIGLHVEANTEELLQKVKDEDPICELTVMQWECLVLITEWVLSGSSLCQVCRLQHPSSTR